MSDLFDHTGRRIQLGREIGAGGEGAVHDVASPDGDLVAKVYHVAIPPEKQAKLRDMVRGCDEALKKIAAWPLYTVHSAPSGPVCGFVMPKIARHQPIHHLYGPSHRKQQFPDKDWAFLVSTARNIAAAFDTIHSHNHVVGDVNPNLVFVADNSIVKLIDCDSFQISTENAIHYCEVGVPYFTAPELQSQTTFRGIKRTRNHDNFGLALLLFHVLLMGRHPFSGVPTGGGDLPLETAIARFCYVYGIHIAGKGVKPPPSSMKPGILPSDMSALFERAFTESGALADGRPTARDWVTSLDSLIVKLRACGEDPTHKYYSGLGSCPWCVAHQQSGMVFFISSVNAAIAADRRKFNFEQLWAQIKSVESPGPAPKFDLSGWHFDAKPYPDFLLRRNRQLRILRSIMIAVSICSLFFGVPVAVLAILCTVIAFTISTGEKMVRNERERLVEEAQHSLATMEEIWYRDAGEKSYNNKLHELSELGNKYMKLSKSEEIEKMDLIFNIRQEELLKYLARIKLTRDALPGIQERHLLALQKHGIRTAADVTWKNFMALNGVDTAVRIAVSNWRVAMEQQFVYNPQSATYTSRLAKLQGEFAADRLTLERQLQLGLEELTQIRGKIVQQRIQMYPYMLAAHHRLHQATVDFLEME